MLELHFYFPLLIEETHFDTFTLEHAYNGYIMSIND